MLKDMEMERSLVKLKEKFVSRAGGACALKRAPGSKEGSLGRKSYYQNVPSNPNLFSNVNLPSRTREGAKEDANRSSSAARRGESAPNMRNMNLLSANLITNLM